MKLIKLFNIIYICHSHLCSPIQVQSHFNWQIYKCHNSAVDLSFFTRTGFVWLWTWTRVTQALNTLHQDISTQRWASLYFPINRILTNMNEQSFLLKISNVKNINDHSQWIVQLFFIFRIKKLKKKIDIITCLKLKVMSIKITMHSSINYSFINCHNPSPSPVQSPKSKVERTWSDSILLCHHHPPPHINFSQQPDIQLSSNFHGRLNWFKLKSDTWIHIRN